LQAHKKTLASFSSTGDSGTGKKVKLGWEQGGQW
jgi:hypothetical protein